MRILLIHTEYKLQGGEDIVFAQEKTMLQNNGFTVATLLFNNTRYSAIKFLLLFFNPFSFIKVLKKIDSFKPNIIHVHNWFFGASPSIFIAARLKKIPVVYTLHNFRILCPSAVIFHNNKLYLESIHKILPIRSIGLRVYKNSFFMTAWVLLCTRLHYFLSTWQNINKIICLTESSKKILNESYLKIPDKNIIVKPHFTVNNNNFNTIKRDKYFLYVGRLSAEKGIVLLLNSFAKSGYKLKIIGKGPLIDEVQKFCKNYKNIEFLNFKTPELVREEMLTCNAIIFPSICFEQFGLVIIEAFSTGTAVISTDVGSPKDLVLDGYNGLLFKTGNQEDLISKLKLWQDIPEDRKALLSQNAYKTYLKNYQPDSSFKMLNNLYVSLK